MTREQRTEFVCVCLLVINVQTTSPIIVVHRDGSRNFRWNNSCKVGLLFKQDGDPYSDFNIHFLEL